jgi:hypothetical protein
MIMNDADAHSLHIHYSPTASYSVGYRAEYRRSADYTIHAVQMNNLLKRWNNHDSQANLYLKSGAGIAYSDANTYEGEINAVAFTGLATDWENRRFFTSYENRYLNAGEIDDFYMQSARVGIAPYIGEYGDVHTWLVLQADHRPGSKDEMTLTPLVRVFKGVNLIEAGVSDRGDLLFNWVMRY